MKLAEAMEIIEGLQHGYRVVFKKLNLPFRHGFPDKDEDPIPSSIEAWDLAERFAKKTKGKYFDITVYREGVDEPIAPGRIYNQVSEEPTPGKGIANSGGKLRQQEHCPHRKEDIKVIKPLRFGFSHVRCKACGEAWVISPHDNEGYLKLPQSFFCVLAADLAKNNKCHHPQANIEETEKLRLGFRALRCNACGEQWIEKEQKMYESPIKLPITYREAFKLAEWEK